MKIKQTELQYLIKESIKKVLLNEISIIDKYQKERDRLNIPFDTFKQLCNLDPTTQPNKVGKYVNWIIAKYNPNADLRKLQRCLEWYSDGVKRGILTRYNIPLDINKYKSYDEFISTMDSLSDNNNTSMSQSEYNNRQKLEGQFDVLGSTSFYDIVAPKTYAAERYFGSNTEWCTVGNESYFVSYSRRGQLYIIYPKNGDSEYKMQFYFEDEQFADKYDEVYENPMQCIELVVKDEGVKQDLVILCKKVFSKYKGLFVSFNERLKDVKQRLLNGESPEDVFDYVQDFDFDDLVIDGFAEVKLNGKWNFINKNGELLSNTWFDESCDGFYEGFAMVRLNRKWNFINKNGEFLSNTWFDECREFNNGFAVVNLNDKFNFINTKGELLSDTWFDGCYDFCNEFAAVVKLNGKCNFINKNGELLSDTWFDKCEDFGNDEFAEVRLNGKCNFINTNGEFLSNTWFNEFKHFHEGFAEVNLNGKWNFINKNGEFLSNTWFDDCRPFNNGFGRINLNDKFNFINTKGELLSDTWFDGCHSFDNGFAAVVKLNGKCNFINTNGKLLSNTWFDDCRDGYYYGTILVYLNGKKYEIDRNGRLYDANGRLIQTDIRNGINLNENKLKKIIRENIKKVLKENSTQQKLYHQSKCDPEIIKSILENGLIKNYDGEADCVWFSTGRPFYADKTLFTVSLPYNKEILKKYRATYGDGYSKVYMFRENIPIEELTIETIPFAYDDNGRVLLTNNLFKSPGFQRKIQEYGCLAKFLANKLQVKTTIYIDIFDKYIEHDTYHYLKSNPMITLKK